jgi:hypothetical protein
MSSNQPKKVKLLPEPDVKELEKRAAWEAMVTHFGEEDVKTMPMPLDELPLTKEK